MEGFGQHSTVSELLGQIQALAYERDSLKFDGRMRHSRKIDKLLSDIGRKSLQLLDPTSRLIQEHEDLSHVICTAFTNERAAAGQSMTAPISLISKLHHILGSLMHTSSEHQRVLNEEKLCQRLMGARQLAESLSKAAATTIISGQQRLPGITEDQASMSSTASSIQKELVALGSANRPSLTTSSSSMDAAKLRSRVAQLETMVEKILKRSLSRSASSQLSSISSLDDGAAVLDLKSAGSHHAAAPPSFPSIDASPRVQAMENLPESGPSYEKQASSSHPLPQSFQTALEEECKLVQKELSQAIIESEGSMKRNRSVLPIKSRVAVRELLTAMWPRSGMWHSPIPLGLKVPNMGLPVAPTQLPLPSTSLLSAAGSPGGMRSGVKNGSEPAAVNDSPVLEGAAALHCISGRSSTRLFEPMMDLTMDFLLPNSAMANENVVNDRDLAPPVSPLLSRLVSLLDDELDSCHDSNADNTRTSPWATPQCQHQTEAHGFQSVRLADSRSNIAMLPLKHHQPVLQSIEMDPGACDKAGWASNQRLNAKANNQNGSDLGHWVRQHEEIKKPQSYSKSKTSRGHQRVKKSTMPLNHAALLDLPPMPPTNLQRNLHLQGFGLPGTLLVDAKPPAIRLKSGRGITSLSDTGRPSTASPSEIQYLSMPGLHREGITHMDISAAIPHMDIPAAFITHQQGTVGLKAADCGLPADLPSGRTPHDTLKGSPSFRPFEWGSSDAYIQDTGSQKAGRKGGAVGGKVVSSGKCRLSKVSNRHL